MITDKRIDYINKVTNKIYDNTASLYEELMDSEMSLALDVCDELERTIEAIRSNTRKKIRQSNTIK